MLKINYCRRVKYTFFCAAFCKVYSKNINDTNHLKVSQRSVTHQFAAPQQEQIRVSPTFSLQYQSGEKEEGEYLVKSIYPKK